jgi:large subunit ribosomal protein L17
MRHLNNTCKLNRTSSHRRCLFANMLKTVIVNEGIDTTVPKANALRRYAEKMVTLAKKNTLAARRQAIGQMMIRFNSLTDKEERAARNGDTSAYNDDRLVIEKLFTQIGPRFASRNGGYTRIIKSRRRIGDNAQTCIIEYLSE